MGLMMSDVMAEKDEDFIVDEAVEEAELNAEENSEAEESSDSSESEAADQDDEVTVSIGEAAPASETENAQTPTWVKEVRKNNKDLVKKNRELEEQLNQLHVRLNPVKTVELGPKPKLDEFDFDPDKYEAALEQWHDAKKESDLKAVETQRVRQEQANQWQHKLDSYNKAKTELKVKDYEDAELSATQSLSILQQNIILEGSENPALLVYALGKNPEKMKEISSIKDPVKYAFAIAKLETQLKVTQRKAAPAPETKVAKGSTGTSGAIDSHLDRLYAEAAKTGDLTKVHRYRMQQKAKGK